MAEPDPVNLPELRAEFPVLRTITTRWMDNDHYGHVNNVVYYSYFDTAVNGYLIEASGCDVRELHAIGIVAETSCRFLRELSFPDTVHAGLAIERLGNSSVVYRIGLFRNEETAPAAIGRFVHVYVDASTRRPVPVPPVIRAALTMNSHAPAPESSRVSDVRIVIPSSRAPSTSRPVRWTTCPPRRSRASFEAT
jgi:acyl-CoA thioester hydrolase